MESFTVITPTGDRPEPFRLCCHYMQRQTIHPTEWIIVDDGVTPTEPPDFPFVKYIRRENNLPLGKHTLPLQMLEALKHVTTFRLVMFEDDDWYCSNYFERMMQLFDAHSEAMLLGQGQAVYYHIPFRKCFQLVNKDRASWCQSAFRSSLIPFVCDVCKDSKDPFIDMKLWRETKSKFLLTDVPPMCIGIKGMPGRVTKDTIGHKGIHPGFKPDFNCAKLRSFIGNDVELYEKYYTPYQRTPKQK